MYNTAKELHIALDLAFQNINSNRKLNIKPHEKDFALNEVMFKEINARVNPKANVKQEGFEDNYKRVDDFENLKVYIKPSSYLLPFKYSDDAVSFLLPADYFRLIDAQVLVNYYGTVGSSVINFYDNDRYYLAYIHVPHLADGSGIYNTLKIVANYNSTDHTILDMANARYRNIFTDQGLDSSYNYSYYNFGSLQSDDSRFMIINTLLESINNHSGFQAKWERFGEFSRKEHLIVIVDKEVIEYTPTTISVDSAPGSGDPYKAIYTFALIDEELFDERFLTSEYTASELASYNQVLFRSKTARTVKSNELSDLQGNYFGKTNYDSPLAVIRNGSLIVYKDDTFDIKGSMLEYYRKPLLINHLINRGCEIDSDDFKIELVNKTAQLLSARASNDPNYQKIVNENIMLT